MTKFAMPCVILCGGKSSRMGRLKQDLLISATKQETLADFQAKRLSAWFSSLYFSAKFEIPNARGIATILDLPLLGDFDKRISPTSLENLQSLPKGEFAPIFGLRSVLESLQCDVFVISIDAPFLDCDSITRLLEAFAKNPKPTFAKNSKTHPLLGIYPLESLAKIKAQIAQGDYKLMRLLDKISAQFVEVDERQTRNLNTPEQYQEALSLLQAQS